jgi:hypothetical protein
MVGGSSKEVHGAPSDWNSLHESRAVGATYVSPALQRWERAIKEENRSPVGTALRSPRPSSWRFLRKSETTKPRTAPAKIKLPPPPRQSGNAFREPPLRRRRISNTDRVS